MAHRLVFQLPGRDMWVQLLGDCLACLLCLPGLLAWALGMAAFWQVQLKELQAQAWLKFPLMEPQPEPPTSSSFPPDSLGRGFRQELEAAVTSLPAVLWS